MSDIKRKFYVTIVISFSVLIGLFYVLNFCIDSVQASFDKLNDINSSIKDYQNKEKYLADINTEISKIDDKKNFLNQAFLLKNKEVDFIIKLEEMAKNTNNELEISVGSMSGDTKKDLKEISGKDRAVFNLKLIGTFPNLLKFMDQMEKDSFVIEIVSLNIQRINEAERKFDKENIENNLSVEGNIKTDMVIYTYIQ